MPEIILSRARRSSAELVGTAAIMAQAIGFGILPSFAICHLEYPDPAGWLVAALSAIVSLVAAVVIVWRLFGREIALLDAGVLRVRYAVGMFHRNLSLPLNKGAEICVVPPGRRDRPNNVFGVGHRSVVIRSNAGHLRRGMALSDRDAQCVADRIRAASEA